MEAVILDGKKLAEKLAVSQMHRVEKLKKSNIVPALSVILIGDHPASQVYVRNKEKNCEKLGIRSKTYTLPQTCAEEEVVSLIQTLNQDPETDGILLQLPLPNSLSTNNLISFVDPRKDVDGFHPSNMGKLATGECGMEPCTPKGICRLLKEYQVPLAGMHAVIIGRSNIVGKPAALMMLRENCTVTICHSQTCALRSYTREADILICAAGQPGMIGAEDVKPGAAVIDVGIHRTEKGIIGDVRFDEVKKVAGYLSPVPGGVGKMTVSMLMENVILSAEMRAKA